MTWAAQKLFSFIKQRETVITCVKCEHYGPDHWQRASITNVSNWDWQGSQFRVQNWELVVSVRRQNPREEALLLLAIQPFPLCF